MYVADSVCVCVCVQSDTFADFEVMTDRLVSEIMYHIDLYGMKPARVRSATHAAVCCVVLDECL